MKKTFVFFFAQTKGTVFFYFPEKVQLFTNLENIALVNKNAVFSWTLKKKDSLGDKLVSTISTFTGKKTKLFFFSGHFWTPGKKTQSSENELVSRAQTFPGKKKYDTFA